MCNSIKLSRKVVCSDFFLEGGVVTQDEASLELFDCIIEGDGASILAREVNTDLVVIDLQKFDCNFASLIDWVFLFLFFTIFVIIINDLRSVDSTLGFIRYFKLLVRDLKLVI